MKKPSQNAGRDDAHQRPAAQEPGHAREALRMRMSALPARGWRMASTVRKSARTSSNTASRPKIARQPNCSREPAGERGAEADADHLADEIPREQRLALRVRKRVADPGERERNERADGRAGDEARSDQARRSGASAHAAEPNAETNAAAAIMR